MAAEDSRLLDKKGHPSYDSTEDATLSIQVPSPFQEDNIQTTHSTNFPVSSSNKNLFKIFNKRAGSYDEDRQALVDESTGIRVWSESYSSIGN
jgi:chloride channel 3/4/5